MRGRLIVLEGGDGAGKATQAALLYDRLVSEGFPARRLDFPRYDTNVFGALIRECLDGLRGDFMSLDPRIAATLYAADRFETKSQLCSWLAAGDYVVLDRYVSANMIHQGAKLTDEAALDAFLSWLEHVEHEVFGMPRPDAICYLHLPAATRARLKMNAAAEGKHGGTIDTAEAHAAHQNAVSARAERVMSRGAGWYRIECAPDGALRTREEIHEEIYQYLTPLLTHNSDA